MKSKFQLYCSCTICKKQTTYQNLNSHFRKHHAEKQIKSFCLHCNSPIYNSNKFCSRSCSATYCNARKDWATIKTGPDKGTVPKTYAPFTKVKQCEICNKWHAGQGKTCKDKNCRHTILSLALRGKTGGNRDANIPGIDCAGKKFFFDSNWERVLADSLTENNIIWTRPSKFILSNGRSYTPDFYLPEYDIYLDPKAHRPNHYRSSILKIEMFESEFNTKCCVISNKKNLTWGHIQTMLLLKSYR